MLHIAVCDDDIKMLGEVKQILTDYCKAKKLAFKISAYCDGTDLLGSRGLGDVYKRQVMGLIY